MEVSTEAPVCTDELQVRPSRPADFVAEGRALNRLMHELAETPDGILQAMVEIMLETFGVGSAGCSVLSDDGSGPRFHWPAVAGAWRNRIGSVTPRDASPCGEAFDRNAPVLFRQPQRRYACLQNLAPPAEEWLVAPFHVGAAAVGTLWLVTHDRSRQFDAEDLRQLITLSGFAAAAYRAAAFFDRMRRTNEALLLGALRQQEAAEAEEKLNAQLREEIAGRKAVEEELQRATLRAKQASLSKSDFLANMSHELRTPLGAILGHAQVMELGPPMTERQKLSVSQIKKAGWHLADLINDVLDLAQVEAGKLSVRMEPVALREILLECQAMMEPLARTRGITIRFQCEDETICVLGDRKRLKQVLINLLSNAIKYNRPDGSVLVECGETSTGRIRIGIKDTGKGLSEAQLSQLFQLFNRLGQDAIDVNGTGIGLVMTKRLTELMGGAVGAESTVGVGSRFWIELNRTPAAAHVPEPLQLCSLPPATGGREKTVLYVEDDASHLMMIQELMAHRHDLRLLSAHDGNEGVEMARENHPDAILLDIQLPDIDGLQVAKILAADPATADIPLIACSANAMPQAVNSAMEAGFFHYLTKPVNVSELMATVDKALAR